MSVLIRGMEMPADDEEIIIRIDSSGTVMTEYALPISWAKAVPVAQHGRLIDADALEDELVQFCDDNWAYNTLRHAPTIIEAEEGE